jgi:hypothetical protein
MKSIPVMRMSLTTGSKGHGVCRSRSAIVKTGEALKAFPALFTFAKGGT